MAENKGYLSYIDRLGPRGSGAVVPEHPRSPDPDQAGADSAPASAGSALRAVELIVADPSTESPS